MTITKSRGTWSASAIIIVLIPVPADFRTNHDVGVRTVVDAQSESEEVLSRSERVADLPPLEATTDSPAIVDRFDQVLVDADGVLIVVAVFQQAIPADQHPVVIPIPADFGTNDDVGVRKVLSLTQMFTL